MFDLLLLFVPFFALVLMGWGAARARFLPLEGIGAMNTFVLFFGLPAMLFRLGASGAFHQDGLLALLVCYALAGAVVLGLALAWASRQGLNRRDGALAALATVFPNTGFLGLPLLTGLLGSQAAGPLAATLVVDVLLLSSVCLAWAHARSSVQADDSAARAVWVSLKGALRNPLLWAMALGMWVGEHGGPLPGALDHTLTLLAQSATPTALFTLGAILARGQMQPSKQPQPHMPFIAPVGRALWSPTLLKLVLHPALVWSAGWGLRQWGLSVPSEGLITLTLAAALPSASNVTMLAEREGADAALVARIILWTTAAAWLTLACWALGLGIQGAPVTT